jgi:uroporphyrinogen decarboxylase
MPLETMTPIERWQAVFHRQRPDRIPMDYWATPEFDVRLMAHLGCATRQEALRKLHIDYVVSPKPEYVGPGLAPRTDVFGCRYGDVDYGTGIYDECIGHPLAEFTSVDDIKKNYKWPDPDWWDYRTIADQLEGQEEYPVRGGGSEPFLTYKYLRGQEQALMDFIEYPEIVRFCLDRLFDLEYENTRRIFERIRGRVTYSYIAEDLGGQTDLMFSANHIREFLLPGMKRMIDLAHQGGAWAFHHDDGNCRRILPDLIALGIDLLNPIQWRCPGMEREALKADFGASIVFHGGVDNQSTLPFGTVDDVRREVLDNLRVLGAGGGYILAPCHNIQALTPPENVVALYETGRENGWS